MTSCETKFDCRRSTREGGHASLGPRRVKGEAVQRPKFSPRVCQAESVPAFLFDLDGTLIDSVCQHVLAWREALERAGMQPSIWRITPRAAERLQNWHADAYAKFVSGVRPRWRPAVNRKALVHRRNSKSPFAIPARYPVSLALQKKFMLAYFGFGR
jgi:hypothetical protein